MSEFFSSFPKAIIIIPIVAKKIEIQTFKEIFSFRNKKANNAVKKKALQPDKAMLLQQLC